MKEKKTPVTFLSVKNNKIMFDLLLAGVISIITIFLPVLSYTYKKKTYDLGFLSLLTGKTICGGKVIITPNIPAIILVCMEVIVIAMALLTPVLKKKISAGISALALIIAVAMNIVIASSGAKLISKGKNVTVAIGSIICLIVCFIAAVRALYILWKLKVLSTLDFMAVPGMLYFIINNYIPMVGIAIAFKKIDYSVGIVKSPWVGFENFKLLFASRTGSFFDTAAFRVTRNTLLYNFAFIVLGIIVGVLVGICLADLYKKTLQKFFQTSILLPQLISMVIVSYIVYALLSKSTGFISAMMGDNAPDFYMEKKFWPFILVIVYIWKMVGYNAIIFLSSIVGIDKSLYEAARVDGASKWTQITQITLPLLKPTVITLFMLMVGRIMYSDFGLFYQVPRDSGAISEVTQTIDVYVYKLLMTLNNISASSAASTYQAIVGFVLVMAVNLIVRRVDKENALF
ncbi:MAG: sugar ABC transporter permease [Bacteroidaceae bacterium]|nr:sugar ABC transporter permease [Bacteroidaceae bacterium]